MEIPKKGEQVTVDELILLCEAHGKDDILETLRSDPLSGFFVSDGCSFWVDTWNGVDLYPACFWHDVRYWCGMPGDDLGRLKADAVLMLDVAETAGVEMAVTMFNGVRVGGSESLPTPFGWGFGRK